MMKNFNKKIWANLFIAMLILTAFSPALALAQNPPNQNRIIPDCGIIVDGKINKECDYNDFLQLIKNIINWLILFSFPVAALVFAWAGFKYMTTCISDQKSAAKSMLVKVFIGFVIILASWLIVNTILSALLNPDFTDAVPVK